VEAFRGPFEAVFQGRWFSQYPPGAPAAYAMGRLIGLDWLVGPLAGVALLAATGWVAGALHGPAARRATIVLGAVSPFVLFQAGSYLSHPIAGGLLAGALAAFVAAERSQRQRGYLACGFLLGAAFSVREAASVLFALPLAIRLIAAGAVRIDPDNPRLVHVDEQAID
jgi:4-amino-4-deoxy-L-arabinose transferase-like glycosyltransferase